MRKLIYIFCFLLLISVGVFTLLIKYNHNEDIKMNYNNYNCRWVSYIGKEITVEIDRPLGSKHPKCDIVYKVNYGFIPGVISGDGEELDAYVLGVDTPLKTFHGICIAIIQRLSEDDDKLIVVPIGKTFSDEEILEKTAFQEQFFESILIR